MVTLLFIELILFQNICICGSPFYLQIESSSECRGKSKIEEISVEMEWDIRKIYDGSGWLISDSGLSPETKYRATVCGGINNDIVTCKGERTWCLEVSNITSGECIEGLSNWDTSSLITYYVITDSLQKYAHIYGIRVQVNDSDDIFNIKCPNGKSTVNYDIICDTNQTVPYSIYQDIEHCYYIIWIYSVFGCVDYEPIQGVIIDYPLDHDQGQACKGKTVIEQLQIELEWDLGKLGAVKGFEKADYIFGQEPNRMFRLSLCQGMQDNSSICHDKSERDLCLEVSTLNHTCIAPLAAWDHNSLIKIFALFNSSNPDKASLKGMRINLFDDMMSKNESKCGSKERPVNVNYELICINDQDDDIDTILIPSVISNLTTCKYNITIMSKWSCATIVETHKHDHVIQDLSAGSILLIVVLLLLVIYVMIGCGYNGMFYGRVGFDAMPNKFMWKQIIRYTYTGCLTTRDMCCFCGVVPTTYQQL